MKLAFAALRGQVRARMARWARRRAGEEQLPVELHARRIYILPTRAGLVFALLLLAMLVAGLNYSNSLALLLCFALSGTVLVGIHECHRNLQGLCIVRAEVPDVFAGHRGHVEVQVANRRGTPRSGVRARVGEATLVALQLPPRSVAAHQLPFDAGRRGRRRLPRIELSSVAPHGLFRAWTWLHLPLEAIVYPVAAGRRPLPGGHARRQSAAASREAGIDEWAQLRPFVPGDSPRAVAWKLYAREAPLLVSQYENEAGAEHRLDFAALHGMSVEARLSQLAAWVIDCARRDEACALHLPGRLVPAGRGVEHRRRCLRALALHGDVERDT